MSAPAQPGPGGLVHLGLRYDSAEGLVGAALPLVRAALDRGEAVSTVLDRRTARDLRAALERGGGVDRLVDRSPHELAGHSLEQFRVVPHWIEPDRRTLVIGQYVDGLTPSDCTVIEDGINLVFPGLPLTVVCACDGVEDPDVVEAWRRGHPGVVDGAGAAARSNDAYRPPADRVPVPAALWGEPALSILLEDVADLAGVRDEVARVAGEAGLSRDDADAAVLAVHEAAVLAVRADGPGRLEVRTGPHGVLSEICSPAGGLETGALRYVEEFSTATTVRESDGGRIVRVLSR